MIFKFYQRNWSINEDDDFEKNLKPMLLRDDTIEAVPQFLNLEIVGWIIKSRYE